MSSEARTISSVLVTGDVVRDHYLYQGDHFRKGSTIRLGTMQKSIVGGAALLFDLLHELAAQKEVEDDQGTKKIVASSWPAVVTFGLQRVPLEKNDGSAKLAHGYCLMKARPELKKSKTLVWRIDTALGFDGYAERLPEPCLEQNVLGQSHDVVVLDDAGIEFRRWPSRTSWPKFILDGTQPLPKWLVLKISSPVAAGDLWHVLSSGLTQDLEPKKIRDPQELLRRTIAVVTINDLRVEPVHVAKPLSWERTALDLARELRLSSHLASLRQLRFLIVSFGADGALLAEFPTDPSTEPTFRLVFDPAMLEGDFSHSLDGTIFGFQTCLTAAVVANLPSPSATEAEARAALEKGIIAGIAGMRRLLIHGHGPANCAARAGFPLQVVGSEIMATKHDWAFGSATVPATNPRLNNWTIVAGTPTSDSLPLWGLARRVAKRGISELQQTPYLEFGKLFSIERSEIESLRTIRRLLVDYQKDDGADKPLSLAVFGPPGAGKSFGVKELANAVFDECPFLEFNLSQFDQPKELHGLFHQIRDKVLEGKMPIVFWDEFDCRELMWLQYLLAPMQDGKFQEGQTTHPLGKCVFVFAGGTRYRYEDFGERVDHAGKPIAGPQDDNSKQEEQEFRTKFAAVKGPDFKSRLAGYLNVLGPNPRDSQAGVAEDITYPVRRALLLRFHLKVEAKAPLAIDPALLSAFLHVKKYKHGSRSLEKIAEQLRRSSRNGEFRRSDIPPANQLDLHVDATEFLALLEQTP